MFKIVAARKSQFSTKQPTRGMEDLFSRKGTMTGDENLLDKVQKRLDFFEKLEQDDMVEEVQASMVEENRIR